MEKEVIIKSEFEKTAVPQNFAEKLYHFQYFILLLLTIEEGQEVGLEKKDDCNVEYTKTGKTGLKQLKHSISVDSEGNPQNLTRKDVGLWHTISNWIDVICDAAEKRTEIEEQFKFIENTDFSLVTNKDIKENPFFDLITSFKNNTKSASEVITEIMGYLKKQESKDILDKPEKSEVDLYIEKLLGKPEDWIEKFIKKINIKSLSYAEIQESCLKTLRSRLLLDDFQLSSIYNCLLSRITTLSYNYSFNKSIVFNYHTFNQELQKSVIKYTSSKKYEVESVDFTIPDEVFENLTGQTFIKQLISIKLIDDEDELVEITENRYAAYNSFSRWEMYDADLDNAKNFKKERKSQFGKAYKKVYNDISNQEKLATTEGNDKEKLLIELGQKCYDETMNKILHYGGAALQAHICEGHFHWQSDIPEIGWRHDWKDLFKTSQDES